MVVVLPLLAVSARPASACSPSHCRAAFAPFDGAVIPANAPALYWRLDAGGQTPVMPTLTAASAPTTPVAFTLVQQNGDFLVVPTAPFVEGETYTFEQVACGETVRSSFTAAAAAPLPSSLGTVNIVVNGERPGFAVQAGGVGECTTSIAATTANVTLERSPTAAPWNDLLFYETRVDDTTWEYKPGTFVYPPLGETWSGRGKDVLWAACETKPNAYVGLTAGGHSVLFRASIPNGPTLSTPAVTVDLACDPDPAPEPEPSSDGGCATGKPAALGLGLALLGLARRRRA